MCYTIHMCRNCQCTLRSTNGENAHVHTFPHTSHTAGTWSSSQKNQNQTFTAESFIWSLGVTLHACTTHTHTHTPHTHTHTHSTHTPTPTQVGWDVFHKTNYKSVFRPPIRWEVHVHCVVVQKHPLPCGYFSNHLRHLTSGVWEQLMFT